MNDGARAFKGLLVEDDPGDVLITREALDGNGEHALSVVPDGVEAMAYLRREGRYIQMSRPDLILLDLNLPRRSGREVLADLKNDPDLQVIPVVVLTTSSAEDDIIASYRLHANAYVIKPVDLDQFAQTVRRIGDFFLSAAHIPPMVWEGLAEGVTPTTATPLPPPAGRLGNAARGRG